MPGILYITYVEKTCLNTLNKIKSLERLEEKI